MNIKNTKIVVDVLSTDNLQKNGEKRFSQENLETAINLVNREAWPEYFGAGIPKSLLLADNPIRLVDDSLINWTSVQGNITQPSRISGKNPKYRNIDQDICNYGYKLRNIPILVKENDNGTYTPINGRTRSEILKGLGFKNFISIVYKSDPVAESEEVLGAILKFGLISNAGNDPAGDIMLEDVFWGGCQAIDNKYIKLTNNYTQDVQIILDWVNEVCGEGKFTLVKRSAVAYRIANTYLKKNRVLSWSVAGQAKEWVKKSKFENIEPTYDLKGKLIKKGLIYVVVSVSTGEGSLMIAVKTAAINKDCNVRVLVHTGTLTGFDVELNYVQKLYNFRQWWENTLSQLSYSLFSNTDPSKSPITLYGALPSVESLGDLKLLKKFTPYTVSGIDDLANSLDDGLEDL